MERCSGDLPLSSREFGLSRHTWKHRLGPLDRSVPHRQANQKDRHGPAREQCEFRVVAPTERTRDSQTEECNDRTDLTTRRPGSRTRHQSIQAQTHDTANLKDDDQELEDGAEIGRGTKDQTGSFLGSCVGHAEVIEVRIWQGVASPTRCAWPLEMVQEQIPDQSGEIIAKGGSPRYFKWRT
jgi:hypothetical protein